MAGYFFQGTGLGELESHMRQVPGFLPHRSGIIRGKEKQELSAPYGELVRLFLEEIPPSRLSVRILNLKNRGEATGFMFRDNQHKMRFRQFFGSGAYDFLYSDHGQAAAVFLLSADPFLWERAKPYITENGIRHGEIRVHGIEPEGYALFCGAKEMCGGQPRLSLSELGDPELVGDGLLRVLLNGILISRHGIRILAEQKENEGRRDGKE